MSKLVMYLYFYCEIFPHFREDNVELPYENRDSFLPSFTSFNKLINNLKHFRKDLNLFERVPSQGL